MDFYVFSVPTIIPKGRILSFFHTWLILRQNIPVATVFCEIQLISERFMYVRSILCEIPALQIGLCCGRALGFLEAHALGP
jgi:hypothetical protein